MIKHENQSDDFLIGIANATNALLASNLDEGINMAIEVLGKQLGVSSTCVYVNEANDGEITSSIRFFWSETPDEKRTAHNQKVPLQRLGLIFETLKTGNYYEVFFSISEGPLREHMKIDGTKSIILFPVMVEGDFWGAIGLVEFRFERQWTDAEKHLLQSLANSIGAAICRYKLEEDLEALVERRTRELERSRLRFELAVEGSQDGIWEWLPQTGENYWSPRMYEQLGYAPHDMPRIGEEFFEMVHPEEAGKARQMFHDHLGKRTPYKIEFRLKTKSGEYRWFRSTGQAQWNEKGEAVRMVGSHEDIHDKKLQEEALKESNRRINNLIDNIPGMAYRCLNTADWPMEYISAACQEITGYEQDDFYGVPSVISFGRLIHPDDQEDMWEQVQEALGENRSYRVIYRIHDRRGREKWLWEQGNGVFEGNEVVALEGCIFDITPIVRNQERVNGAIYQAEDSERRRIAGEIHDGLQQTLSVSALNLQYLEAEIDKLSRESQERFRKSRKYLEQGISESRQIAHRLMPKAIHDVGLDRAVQDLIAELENLGEMECDYHCNLTARLDQKVEVGLYRTTQEALNNILKNSQAKKVNIQLMMFENEVQLMIEDDGIGFDKNKLDLYKTGFGLTGMKNRINSLSGTLHIDTRPGHGTSIVARVPLKRDNG